MSLKHGQIKVPPALNHGRVLQPAPSTWSSHVLPLASICLSCAVELAIKSSSTQIALWVFLGDEVTWGLRPIGAENRLRPH
jgi:hypothetical protein